jgi:hypothetical protein
LTESTYRWVPLMGEFEIEPAHFKFKGKTFSALANKTEEPVLGPGDKPLAAVGLILCDKEMVNGKVSADISFAGISEFSVCELIMAHDPESKGQVSAGIGGSFSMFSIREWVPASLGQQGGSWTNYELAGDRVNLKVERDYHVEVRLTGSKATLHVDGVNVGTATIPNPNNQPRQVGVFCIGYEGHDVTIRNFNIEAERPQAFVVMQFSSPYNEVYSHVIKNVCEEYGVSVIRADEIYGPGIIIKDVIDRIARSGLVIAEISPANPNVYFEVGYALALQKPIILLAKREGPDIKLPFDVSAFRVLPYEDSISGKSQLEQGLRNHLSEILGRA